MLGRWHAIQVPSSWLGREAGITAATLGKAGVTGPAKCSRAGSGCLPRISRPLLRSRISAALTDGLGSTWDSRQFVVQALPGRTRHPSLYRCDPAAARTPRPQTRSNQASRSSGRALYRRHSLRAAEREAPSADGFARPGQHPVHARRSARDRPHRQEQLCQDVAHRSPDPRPHRSHRLCPWTKACRGRKQFKGVVRIELTDGTVLEEIEEHNRGSLLNPMTLDEIAASSVRTSPKC